MSLVVHHNVAAHYARLHLARSQDAITLSTERLSSGYRINRPGDDTTAYALSMRLDADLSAYGTANRNTRNGMNLITAIEGTADEILRVISRMRELAVKSATGSMTDVDRSEAQIEFNALQQEVQRLAQTTHMNQVQGLAISDTMTFQVGVAGGIQNQVVLSLRPMTLGALSMQANTLDIRTLTHARDGLNKLEAALSRITTRRSRLGATYRQLEAAFDVTGSERESILVTLGAIRDTDYAAESTNLARNQIMSQAAVSILAQANTIPQLALQLLS